uniref:Uncharacterized protein n=1 Tax=Avena sativa TaxID=4498 RepID=A0ACD5VXS1_AVESA
MAKKKKLAEAPLTEYEKVRARNMMRNNRIFVSLSISGISAIIRRVNGGQEGSSITNDDSTSAITQGESSDYNPNEDEAIAEEEVDDSVVETGIKVPKACRRKRGAIKKISKKANNSEASSTMAPVWVLAVPPGRSERLFDIAEADPTPRVTGQKVKDKAISTKDGSPLEKNVGSLPQQNVESSLHLIVESSPHMDVGYGSMDEGSTVRMDLSPIAPTVARQPLDCDVFAEEPEHPTSDEGTSIEECKVADLSAIEMFKATQNSTKKGFSVEALDSIAEMEAEMAKTVPEGETPKSATEIIAQVLTMDNRSNTFLKNVGLQSGSKNKFNKTNAEVSAHVIELEDRLEKSQQETVEMRAELAAMKKKKAAEAEAAQAQRDKEYQLLLKRTEESNARVQHMMAMFGGNSSGK